MTPMPGQSHLHVFMRKPLFLLTMRLLLVACDKAENEYTSRTCYLVIDNSVHQDATLAAAMTRYSNVFATVSIIFESGAQYFYFQSNQGGTPTKSIFNAIDRRRTFRVGMNNGVIVGYGSLEGRFYAYDRECPNCFNPNAIPVKSYPLNVATNGIASCNNCRRKYDLNIGGILVEGDYGSKMTHYRSGSTGPYGNLSVN